MNCIDIKSIKSHNVLHIGRKISFYWSLAEPIMYIDLHPMLKMYFVFRRLSLLWICLLRRFGNIFREIGNRFNHMGSMIRIYLNQKGYNLISKKFCKVSHEFHNILDNFSPFSFFEVRTLLIIRNISNFLIIKC